MYTLMYQSNVILPVVDAFHILRKITLIETDIANISNVFHENFHYSL